MRRPRWGEMNDRPRLPMQSLRAGDLPDPAPGVYALYRDGEPLYVGLAEKQSLRGRIWGSHRGRCTSMTGSALRRNVAQHLGIATARDIKNGVYKPTADDAACVVAWIDACDIAWIECASSQLARTLEDELKKELMPRLTKR